MGFYLEGPITGKADYLIDKFKGEPFNWSGTKFDQIPEGKVAIIVVYNGYFEAAGIAVSQGEYDAFTHPQDIRPRTGILVDKELARAQFPGIDIFGGSL